MQARDESHPFTHACFRLRCPGSLVPYPVVPQCYCQPATAGLTSGPYEHFAGFKEAEH
jgi:hypothetical protein